MGSTAGQSGRVVAAKLDSWRDSEAKRAIEEFVERVVTPGARSFVEPEARVAVFDNDGTLWCEKPMPVELGFILQRLAGMAAADTSLRDRQPWKAACERDYAWLGDAVTKHYHGDDSDVRVLVGGILEVFEGVPVETYQAAARHYLDRARHPTLKLPIAECAYAPMIELLRYLEAHGFTNYIASGGNRDFMRVITEEIYGIPAERVIGSSSALRYAGDGNGGTLAYLGKPDVFDDGPAKPVRIWSRIGQRPILAIGNSNGDVPMLEFAGGGERPSFRALVLHDDGAREFDYRTGAEKSLELAAERGWKVISMKHDWSRVFARTANPGIASRVPA